MPAGNANFDALITTTLDKYANKLVDNIFNDRPFLRWLMEKKRLRLEDGGRRIIEPLIYGKGQAVSYGEWDPIQVTPQEGISAAEYPWKSVAAPIVISGQEEAQNSGTSQIINLLRAKVMQAEETLKDSLNAMAYGDGTGNSGKDILGLGALVASTEGPATVGNIVVADNTWWRSQVYDKALGSSASSLRAYLTTAYNAASKGNDTPDLLLSDFDVFELYESQLLPNVRYTDVESANAGFTNLTFKGATYFPDADAPAKTVFGLNSKYIGIVGDKKRWFKMTPFTSGLASTPTTGSVAAMIDGRFSWITSYLNLVCSNRARQFKVYNIPLT